MQVDLAGLDFEQRLAVLSATTKPAPKLSVEAAKESEEEAYKTESLVKGPETKFWKPEFWGMCIQDLKQMKWPSQKSVAQTLLISQVAFVAVIVIVLICVAFVETGMRSLLLDEPFTITLDKILKVKPPPS